MITFKNSRTFAVAVIMTLLLCTTCVKCATSETTTGIGTGTIDDPFQVNSVAALKKVGTGDDGWTLTANYKQTANIVLTKRDGNWTPIGVDDDPFNGSYDGNGCTIKNLTINATTRGQGLFGYVGTYSTVKNVGLINCSITSTVGFVGGVVGVNEGDISNIYATGSISGGVGGVAGSNGGYISNCYATGSISGGGNVGGVVGVNKGDISNSYAKGSISGGSNVGGVVGGNGGYIGNCYATANISGSYFVGGVAGSNSGYIENCYATGNVLGSGYYIGGIAGTNNGLVANSYATGNVLGVITGLSSGVCVGGVIGANDGNVINNYATGSVSGSEDVGGVVGANYGNVMNNYATGSVSGREDVGGVVGDNSSVSVLMSSYATGRVSGGLCAGGVAGRNSDGCIVMNSYATGNVSGSRYVGGVVGYNDGFVDNCVALNGVITRTSGTYNQFGRVAGYQNSSRPSPLNNFARSNMKFTGIAENSLSTAITSNSGSIHGEDIKPAEWSSSTWWTEVVWHNEMSANYFVQEYMTAVYFNSGWTEDGEWDDSLLYDFESNGLWDFSNISATRYPKLRRIPLYIP